MKALGCFMRKGALELKLFNLVEEGWIPISGCSKPLGIREALLQAQDLPRIEHSSPLVTIALYRLLLAVLHRALEGPNNLDESLEWMEAGRFPADRIQAYLDRHYDRFWLFHPEHPFYQMPDLPLEGFADPWTRLTSEFGSGNTSFLTNHRLREKKPELHTLLSFPEAACRLLEFQSFALGGLMKRFVTSASGAMAVQGVLVLADGASLFEQLIQSMVSYPKGDRDRDRPIWEKAPYRRAQLDIKDTVRESLGGITSLYTWFARSVRLFPCDDRVADVAISAGVVAEEGLGALEPMFCFVNDEDGQARPLGFRSGRALWRDFHALLPDPSKSRRNCAVIEQATALCFELGKRRPQFRVFGISKDQAKVLGMHTESFVLPALVLDQVDVFGFIKQRLEEAEAARRALSSSIRLLAKRLLSQGEREPDKDDVTSLTRTFPHEELFLPRIKRHFLRLIEELPAQADEFFQQRERFESSWRRSLVTEAHRSLDQAGIAAGASGAALMSLPQAKRFLAAALSKAWN